MSDKRPSSTKLRRQCVETNRYRCPLSQRWLMDCHLCDVPIDLALSAAPNSPHAWEAEHVTRRVLSKDDGPDNIKPAHINCHAIKTRRDIQENAKGKRLHDRHFGVTRRSKSRWAAPEGFRRSWKTGRMEKAGGDE